jgi:hypothetical protein
MLSHLGANLVAIHRPSTTLLLTTTKQIKNKLKINQQQKWKLHEKAMRLGDRGMQRHARR